MILTLSLTDHLIQLLNTRQGSLLHMPDYGLPDLGAIYQNLPYSLGHFKQQLSILLDKYEPRLKNSVIQHKPITQYDAVMCLIISKSDLNWETHFFSNTRVDVRN